VGNNDTEILYQTSSIQTSSLTGTGLEKNYLKQMASGKPLI